MGLVAWLALASRDAIVLGQIGSGWTQYFPAKTLQQENSVGYSSYTDVNGVETFKLWANPQRSRQRCEIRVQDDYTSGTTQFEGDFHVTRFDGTESGDDVCIAQVWLSMMMSVSGVNDGSMRQHSGFFADHLLGRWVRMNVYHDATNHQGEVWLDGVKVWSGPTKKSNPFYHKYGLYNEADKNPEVQWKQVKFFRGGTTDVAVPNGPLALKGRLLFEDNFTSPAQYTRQLQSVSEGWRVRSAHANWVRTGGGVRSRWESGHMPVLAYEGKFADVVIELDFRYQTEPGKWAACRISATNAELNPRAYAASVWANANNQGRPLGMVLEHDEWSPGIVTTVTNRMARFEPDTWYTLRLELLGDKAQATCHGVTVCGTHEKFGLLPKTSLWLGVGTCPHELRKLRVYEASLNPAWRVPVASSR